ncbi:MAG: hypothetical protein C4320_06900, partial [Armatimonadota bacterium]
SARTRLRATDSFAPNLIQIEMASLAALGRLEEAAALGQWAESFGIESVLVRYETARALAQMGELESALRSVEHALATPPQSGETGDPAVRGWKARLLRARLRLELGDESGAVTDAGGVLDIAP